MKKRIKKSGKELFAEYYSPEILTALKKPSKKILRFSEKNKSKIEKLYKNLTYKKLDFYANAITWPLEIPEGEKLPGIEEGLIYVQNASSLLPVLALDPKDKEFILDSCAAPGGKASMIMEIAPKVQLSVNDTSTLRLNRLLKTFAAHQLPKPQASNKNAALIFKTKPEYYDKILIDAPCSSEKHVLNSEKHLNQWSPRRIKELHHRQLSLINGLFLALKPGGQLVYSTCAINEEENQKVLSKFLKKHAKEATLINYPSNLPGFKKNSPYGQIDITKEKNNNFDPMFIAIIKKNEL